MSNSRTQNFTYDALNRITQGYTTGGSWGETFTIDAWGNLTNRGLVAGKSTYEPLNAAPATVKNQLTGFGYDAAGNMISNGSSSYTYDAENRLTATAGWTYVYDGDGVRVIKCNGAYPTCSAGTLYWGGANALAESSLTGTMGAEYLFYLGQRMARNDLPGNIAHYYLQDHLGSARVTTNATGATEKQTDYSPYGGEIWVSGTNVNHYKFTGKERDAESGLDNFGVRYHSSAIGRFASPDPTRNSAHSIEPQSWNRYSYVSNNPLKFVDPDGAEKRLVVYIQQPVLGKPTVWVRQGFTANVGHSFIGLKDTDAKTEIKRGFYPSKSTDPTSPTVPGVVKDNADHSWSVKKEFVISDQQYDKLNQSVASDFKNPPEYDLNKNNCTDWVNQKATEVGVTLPDPQGTWPGGQGSNPGMEGQALRDQGGEVNDENGSGGSSGSSGGSSNNVPANDHQADVEPEHNEPLGHMVFGVPH